MVRKLGGGTGLLAEQRPRHLQIRRPIVAIKTVHLALFLPYRATLIMSPYGDIRNSPCYDVTTIEMSPNLEVSTGGQIGTDRDKLQGIATSRGIGASGSGKLKLVNAAVIRGHF